MSQPRQKIYADYKREADGTWSAWLFDRHANEIESAQGLPDRAAARQKCIDWLLELAEEPADQGA